MRSAIIKAVSSWWLTAALLVVLTASYLFFSFGEDTYIRWTEFLFRSASGTALYCALIVNLAAATVRLAVEALSRPPSSPDAVRNMDAWTELPTGKNGLKEVAIWLQRKGFKASLEADSLSARRGSWSFLPGTVLRAGVAGLLVSILVSVHVRQTVSATLHTGEETNFFGARVTAGPIEADLPEDFLQVGDESTFLLQDARLQLTSGGKTTTIPPGFPRKLNGSYYRLTHLGYAQPLSARAEGKVFDKTIDLDVLPPGKAQIIPLPSGAIFLSLSLEPDRTISKGLLKGKQFNLSSPFYRIRVQAGGGRTKPAVLTIKPGESGQAGETTLSLGASRLYARVTVVNDPALFWVYFTLAFSGLGLLMMLTRFFWYRKLFSAVLSGDLIIIGVQEEFFKKWGIERFYSWKEELQGLTRSK